MKINKKELKKISHSFLSISSRFIRVDFADYDSVLDKFLLFLDENKLISDYISNCGKPSYDIATEVEAVMRGDAVFDLGETEVLETANIYHILKHLRDNEIDVVYSVCRSYRAGSDKYQDMVRAFNNRVVLVLVRHIEDYLTRIGIDMGIDENTAFTITVNNGQVNLASDNATISANQYNGIDASELQRIIIAVKKSIPDDMPPEEVEKANECLEDISVAAQQSNPRKSFFRTALATLQSIKASTEFAAAVVTLIQFLQPLL
jgi:hypothetical protein